jgi:RimJ/RimL family protein N-acetyltransferase
MELLALTREQVQKVREWRNEELQFLRTPYLITRQMQDEFYDNVVNNRNSKHRYYALIEDKDFIGMCGLTNIEWENGTAEISLIITPFYRGKGYGAKAVSLLLDEAFNNMRLYSVFGEVYNCGNRDFWEKVVIKNNGYQTDLRNRKWYNGEMYDSMWFAFSRER